jgi:hypothetical protein
MPDLALCLRIPTLAVIDKLVPITKLLHVLSNKLLAPSCSGQAAHTADHDSCVSCREGGGAAAIHHCCQIAENSAKKLKYSGKKQLFTARNWSGILATIVEKYRYKFLKIYY